MGVLRHIAMKSLLILLGLLGLGNCGIFTRSKCVDVPSNLCAVVYDDEKCNGWALNINEGEIMFKWWDPVYYWYRNDIESVSVRRGCTIRSGSSSDTHVTLSDEDEYEDYDEKIQSISC